MGCGLARWNIQVTERVETKRMEMAKSTNCGKCSIVLGVWRDRMIEHCMWIRYELRWNMLVSRVRTG